MSDQSFKYQLIFRVLSQLEAEGYAMGTGQYLRVQELLRKLPDDIPMEELDDYLVPLFAQSPKQQQAVHDIFKQNLKATKKYYEQLTTQPVKTTTTQQKKLSRWWKLMWGLGILFLVPPLILFLLWLITPDTPTLIAKPFQVKGGSSKQECVSDSLDMPGESPVVSANLLYQHDNQLGTVLIDTPYCITYVADSLSGKDSIVIELVMEDEEVQLVCYLPEIQGIGPAYEDTRGKRQKPVEAKLDSNYTFYNKIPPYDHDILAFHINEPPWWKTFIAQNFWWLKWLGLLSFTALLLAVMRYRSAKRQSLVLSAAGKDRPPYAYHLKLQGVEQIQMGNDFAYVLNRIRQRTSAEAIRLDVPLTISATIKKAGMVDFQFSRQTRPPEYILLIDRQSERNHRARLFDYIFRLFKANEVLIERFFYDGDPRVCYNKLHPNGILLQDLQQRYNDARLLILGNGAIFLNKFTGKPVDWCHLILGWKDRVLFTPKPTNSWGKQERRLKSLLTVLPVSIQSLNFWLEQLENEEDAAFDNWHKQVEDALEAPITLEGSLIQTLKAQYSEKMLKWIAACSIYPSLHWDLTMHLGQWLSDDREYLLTVGHILQLTQLPWFVEGKIPEASRLQLVEWMEVNYPQELHQLRVEVVRLLEDNPPPQDSSAYEDYRLNVALNEWMTTSGNQKKRELEDEIAQYLELGGEVDITVASKLKKDRSVLDTYLPEKWKQSFYKQGLPGLGWKGEWGDMLRWAMPLWLCALLLTLWPWQMQRPACADGVIVDYVQGGAESSEDGKSTFPLCINDSRAVYMLMEKSNLLNLDDDSLRGNDQLLAASITRPQQFMIPAISGNDEEQLLWRTELNEPLEIAGGILQKELLGYSFANNQAGMDDLTDFVVQYWANKTIALYNLGVEYSHQYEDAQDENAFSRACFYFDLAINTDSTRFTAEDKLKIANWCDPTGGSAVVALTGSCVQVTDAIRASLAVRDRPLTDEEMKQLNAESGQPGWSELSINKSSLIGTIPKGQQVDILEESNDYYLIRVGRIEGYIVKRFGGQSTLVPCETTRTPEPDATQQSTREPDATQQRIPEQSTYTPPTTTKRTEILNNDSLIRRLTPPEDLFKQKSAKPEDPVENDPKSSGEPEQRIQLMHPDSLFAKTDQLRDCNLSVRPSNMLEVNCIEITNNQTKVTFTLRNTSRAAISYSLFDPSNRYAFQLVDGNGYTYGLRGISGARFGTNQLLRANNSITFSMTFEQLPAETNIVSIRAGDSYTGKDDTYWNFPNIRLDWK